MDETTRGRVTKRWSEYGIRLPQRASDEWSGQGERALERLLASLPYRPGSVAPAALRANGVRELGSTKP
jgi:hypothetical protein